MRDGQKAAPGKRLRKILAQAVIVKQSLGRMGVMTVSNYKPTAKEEEFVKYHERLRDEINIANWHFAIWKYLWNLHKDYIDELNRAPAFFSLTMRAHLLATAMRLNKFFDKPEDNISIYEFLNFAEQNLDIFSNQAFEKRNRGDERYDIAVRIHTERTPKITPELVKEHRQKIEKLPKHNLRKWRNKALAHIDKKSVLRGVDILKEYPVKIEQVDEIIDTIHDILNHYSAAYDGITWEKDLVLEPGIQEVMDSIRFKTREERKQ